MSFLYSPALQERDREEEKRQIIQQRKEKDEQRAESRGTYCVREESRMRKRTRMTMIGVSVAWVACGGSDR